MAAKLMHAVQYKSFGGGPSGLKHVEIPIPTLKKDEVLLKLEAASLNPGDFKIQKGLARPFLLRKLPHTPATDVAGDVVEVGQGAKKFKFGDKVVVLLSHFSGGGLAEFAATNERLMVARPPEVSAAEGACLPVAGLTAPQALTQCAGVKVDGTGQNKEHIDHCCLWWRGALCSPTSKAWDTNVTATCGAYEVLEYRTADGAALKSPSGRKYDFVIDCGKGNPWSTFESNLNAKGCCRHFSDVSSLATFVMKKLTFSKKQQVPLLMIPKDVNLEYLVKLVKEGKLKPVIDLMHPLSKAEDAWLKSIDGHATGNIILEL
ncbi:unnamed protein product [Malus baccata var. baccata]